MKILHTIIKVVLCLVLALSIIASILPIALNTTVLKKGLIDEKITDEDFKEAVVSSTRNELENKATSTMPEWLLEVYDKNVTPEDLVAYSQLYFGHIHDHMVDGKKLDPPNFEHKDLYNAILAEVESRSSTTDTSDAALPTNEEVAEINYSFICDNVKATIGIAGNKILNKLPAIDSAINKLNIISYICIFLAISSFALILITNRKQIEKTLYLVSAVSWTSSALLFIPSLMFKQYGFADKIIIDIPFFKIMVRNVINITINRTLLISGILIVLVTALLVVSIVMILRKAAYDDRKKMLAQKYAELRSEAEKAEQ